MTARECIDQTVDLVGDSEAKKILEKIDKSETLTESEEKIINRLIAGVNIAVDTIVSRYFETIATITTVSDAEQKIDYKSLAPRVFDVVEVKSKNVKVDFYTLPFSLFVPAPNTAYEVTIKYLPERISALTDELALLPVVPIRAVSYIMASDIYLTRGMFEESRYWHSNFEKIMTQVKTSRRTRTLKVKHLV